MRWREADESPVSLAIEHVRERIERGDVSEIVRRLSSQRKLQLVHETIDVVLQTKLECRVRNVRDALPRVLAECALVLCHGIAVQHRVIPDAHTFFRLCKRNRG